MDEFLDDALAELGSVAENDCGCGGGGVQSNAPTDDLGLPSLDELNSALSSTDGVDFSVEDDELFAELDLADVDLDDPFQDLGDDTGGPSLKDILEIAERNPGLKITLSY